MYILHNFLRSRYSVVGVGLLLLLAGVAGRFYHPSQTNAGDLSTVSITLSNPRPSFYGKVGTGSTGGSSLIYLNVTPAAAPSTSSAQLKRGDSIKYGLLSYTVAATVPDANFTTTTAPPTLVVGNYLSVLSTASATVKFIAPTAVSNGSFRVLVPAAAASYADSIPDAGFFDYGTGTPTVTCPTGVTGYSFSAGVPAAGSVTVNSQLYHSYKCSYTGTGTPSADFTTTGKTIIISPVHNPAPVATHTLGTADSNRIIVQQLDGSDNVIDDTSAAVGVVESVKVTAEVPPQIAFSIRSIGAGTSACGVNTDIASTPLTVPFGELTLNTFRNAAQRLVVSTNAVAGYAVTVLENDQMGRQGITCTGEAVPSAGNNFSCIKDTTGDSADITESAPGTWATATFDGFAYTLKTINGSQTMSFEHNTSSGNCAGANCYKQFPDNEQSQAAATIFSYTTVADAQTADICYRVAVKATQATGEYENYITFNATATF